MRFLLITFLFALLAVAAITADHDHGCDTMCTSDYTPVCALNERGEKQTYPNQCALDVYNCQHKTHVVAEQGEC